MAPNALIETWIGLESNGPGPVTEEKHKMNYCVDRLYPRDYTRTLKLILSGALLLLSTAMSPMAFADERVEAEEFGERFEAAELDARPFDPNAGLEGYLAFAASNNPGLKAAYYNWIGKLKRAGHVGGLPEPMLSYGYFVENVETRVGPQNQRIGLRQNIPWFGSLGDRKDMANSAAGAAYQEFRSRKLRIFNEVKRAYYNLYYLGREIELTRDNITLLTLWESVARTRYSSGLSKYQDVLKAQVELGLLGDKLQSLRSAALPLAAELRVALGVTEEVTIPFPETLPLRVDQFERSAAIQGALANNPDIEAFTKRIESAQAERDLAGKSSYPNLTLGLDYIETGEALNPALAESGKDPLMLSLGVSLPVWFGKNSAKRAEAGAKLRRAQYAKEDKEARIIAAVERALYAQDDAQRKLELYNDALIPSAEQALNATFAAYENGDADFLSLLDSQRMLLDFQLKYDRAKTDLARALTDLETLTGFEE